MVKFNYRTNWYAVMGKINRIFDSAGVQAMAFQIWTDHSGSTIKIILLFWGEKMRVHCQKRLRFKCFTVLCTFGASGKRECRTFYKL